MGKLLGEIKHDLMEGKGFILLKGVPVEEWDLHKCAAAYMGLGTYLGYFVSQNSRGHVLGHVKDVGDDPTQTDKVRIYRTNARYVSYIISLIQSLTEVANFSTSTTAISWVFSASPAR